jgi:hypothetical protein
MMSYEEELTEYRKQLIIRQNCLHYVLQTYDNGDNSYFGCNKYGLIKNYKFYPSCLMQCVTKANI